jgi:predicted transcriptional regulator
MITANQLRAARALLGVDQKTLAEMAGVSLPTIQRMEASEGDVRGIVDSLMKVVNEPWCADRFCRWINP